MKIISDQVKKVLHGRTVVRYTTLAMLCGAVALQAEAETPQPVVWWKMDSLNAAGQVPDATGNGNHLNVGSGCSLVKDPLLGSVISFNGCQEAWGQALSATQFTGSRSVSIWIRRAENDGPMDPAVNKIPYVFKGVSGTLVCHNWDKLTYSIGPTAASSFQLMSGRRLEWMHMVAVVEHDPSDETYPWKLRGYKDGISVMTDDTPAYKGVPAVAGTGAEKITVGNTGVGSTRPFCGMMADMRVYDKALTADEVKKLYLDTVSRWEPYLIGYWKMDELGEPDSSGKRIVTPTGRAHADLVAGETVVLSNESVTGKSAFFPNEKTSAMTLAMPYGMNGFSFGVFMNVYTNLAEYEKEEINNKYPHIFNFPNYARMCIEDDYREMHNNGAHVFDVVTLDNTNDSGFRTPSVTAQKGRWSHLGVTFQAELDEESGLYGVKPRIYVDGVLVSTGRWKTASAFTGMYPKDLTFILGNMGTASPRPFGGLMDEFCFFSGSLSDSQMKELSFGLPSVSAGEDFTVSTASARLCGVIGTAGIFGNRPAAAVTALWSIVSVPEGGEAAAFVQPADVRSYVSLPVDGEYVFRLTITDSLGRTDSSDVTVTRTAAGANVAPTVSVSGEETALTHVPVTLTAAAADSDAGPGALRVSWKALSGPGAVRFEPAQGAVTKATFFAAGDYSIAAVVSDGTVETVSTPHTVTVSADGEFDIENGLIAYWPFDATKAEKITGTAYTVNGVDVTMEPGLDKQAVRCHGAFYPYLNTNMKLLETEDPELAPTPVERYRAFSCWIYHDSSDTNGSSHATIVDVPYTLGLWYNCEDDVRGFTMYQQTLNSWNAYKDGCTVDSYGRPENDPLDRWTHVYALFDRRTNYLNTTSQLWIDGKKQTNYILRGMGGGRVNSKQICIGGHPYDANANSNNGHFKDKDGNLLSRTFPGMIDEVRMYNRALTEREIRYLASHPMMDVRRSPAVSGEPDAVKPTTRKIVRIDVKANTDVYPASAELVYAWCVLSGDASRLVFSDPDARTTDVTVTKAGTYVIQLAVSDGSRTTYSAPVTVEVRQAGTVVSLR